MHIIYVNVIQLCCPSYHGVVVGHVEQVHAALGVCKGAYSQAVGGMELLHQEVTANLDDL